MVTMELTASRYRSILWPSKPHTLSHEILLILAGCLLLTLASQITLPLKPVPITFQTFAVLLIGMTYGAKRAISTVSSYLLLGAWGLPIFHDFSAGLSGVTAGYLYGFIVAAGLTGYLSQRGWCKKPLPVILTALLGVAAIFLCGLPVLAAYVGWENIFEFGVFPFIPGEIVKIGMLSSVAPWFWHDSRK